MRIADQPRKEVLLLIVRPCSVVTFMFCSPDQYFILVTFGMRMLSDPKLILCTSLSVNCQYIYGGDLKGIIKVWSSTKCILMI